MTLNDYFDMILVINLDKDKDRLALVTQEFEKINTTFDRVPGNVCGTGNKIKDRLAGCYLSHLSCMELAFVSKAKRVLICEDDVVFNPSIVQDIPAIEHIEYDMLWFNGRSLDDVVPNFAYKGGPKHQFHCYSLSNVSERFVDHFRDHLSFENTLTPDAVLNVYPLEGMRYYHTYKLYAIQRAGMSSILGRYIARYDYNKLNWMQSPEAPSQVALSK
jgi:GR25 family glycosyltransferase involved in LPS biosynthesis